MFFLTQVSSYLNVPFDLSQVLFIATANSMATIPPALLDRTEMIHIPGYTQEEKFHIACRHLIPKQLKEHGLTRDHITITDDSVTFIGKFLSISNLGVSVFVVKIYKKKGK